MNIISNALTALKRNELQKLAMANDIKANQKSSILIDLLLTKHLESPTEFVFIPQLQQLVNGGSEEVTEQEPEREREESQLPETGRKTRKRTQPPEPEQDRRAKRSRKQVAAATAEPAVAAETGRRRRLRRGEVQPVVVAGQDLADETIPAEASTSQLAIQTPVTSTAVDLGTVAPKLRQSKRVVDGVRSVTPLSPSPVRPIREGGGVRGRGGKRKGRGKRAKGGKGKEKAVEEEVKSEEDEEMIVTQKVDKGKGKERERRSTTSPSAKTQLLFITPVKAGRKAKKDGTTKTLSAQNVLEEAEVAAQVDATGEEPSPAAEENQAPPEVTRAKSRGSSATPSSYGFTSRSHTPTPSLPSPSSPSYGPFHPAHPDYVSPPASPRSIAHTISLLRYVQEADAKLHDEVAQLREAAEEVKSQAILVQNRIRAERGERRRMERFVRYWRGGGYYNVDGAKDPSCGISYKEIEFATEVPQGPSEGVGRDGVRREWRPDVNWNHEEIWGGKMRVLRALKPEEQIEITSEDEAEGGLLDMIEKGDEVKIGLQKTQGEGVLATLGLGEAVPAEYIEALRKQEEMQRMGSTSHVV